MANWYQFYANKTKVEEFSTEKYVVSKATLKSVKKGVDDIFHYFDAQWYAIRPSDLENGKKHFQQAKKLFEKGNPNTKNSEEILTSVAEKIVRSPDAFWRLKQDKTVQDSILLNAYRPID